MPPPTFIGIGPMKCGTSTVHHYLRSHPEVFVPAKKELNWFFKPEITKDQYEKNFDEKYVVRGEISPNYQFDWAYTRISSVYPNAKIIIFVRNPIKRFISAVRHLQNSFPNETKYHIDEIFKNLHGNSGIFSHANYDAMLKIMRAKHPVHIVRFDDLVLHQQKTFNKLCDFLEVSHHKTKQMHFNSSNKRKFNKIELSEKQVEILKKEYYSVCKSVPWAMDLKL